MDLNKGEEGVDWISNLPDSLIHHILSFLNIKHVAQTSVLSKRWSYIWITVPILDFQDWVCIRPTSSETNKFMDFVDGTLHRRHSGANIQRFAITWYNNLNEYRVNSWIFNAVRSNVQQVTLRLIQNEPMIITRSLFTCESLISLKLNVVPSVCFPNYISFPKLKCLELDRVAFSNEYWNEKLFSNCPVLEDFSMEHCTWFGIPSFCISTPALKHFKIDNWEDEWLPRGEDDGLRVVQFRFKPYVATREQRIDHGAAISQFLRALVNVKRLSVSGDTLQALSFAEDLLEKLPTFHNTKDLIVYEEVTADKALVALLKATPNLESLIFYGPLPSDDEEEDYVAGSDADAAEGEDNHDSEDDVAGSDSDASEGEDNHGSENDDWTLDVVTADPECLFLHLKSVYFLEFSGIPMEIRWLKLILKNAKALQAMSISTCDKFLFNTRREVELMVEILSLPRASTSCVFKLPSWLVSKLDQALLADDKDND
ncbi:F-box/LRR-repeat protein At4g14103-like isoform X2 [Papaver somniferum]|uniref:F-box/LRR-repeat protein At4g14103-like isoform X2 n=1 Tax=Papaver somniferum TaxID=3469 RepID=UPI000E704B0E|nr:F-box/LRR-repeat protein At4g14103-like isoform X2 [Papaver somniferum]